MKAAIIFAIYNKPERVIRNTLYALSRQIVPFEVEICIVDDCSEINPHEIVYEYIPNAHYKRLERRLGSRDAKVEALKMVSDDVDTIVITGSDVIMLNTNTIDYLCEHVEDRRVIFAEVYNDEVKDSLNDSNIGEFRKHYNNQWDELYRKGGRFHAKDYHIYTGRNTEGSWLFYLGAITKQNIMDIGYMENSCDAVIAPKMKEMEYEAEILTYVKGVHQRHVKIYYPCDKEDTCEYYCMRTRSRGIKRRTTDNKKAIVRTER